MSAAGPPGADPLRGFEVSAVVDRAAYRAGDVVRISVAVTNDTARFVVHRYPGWRRFDLSIRDANHRPVATAEVEPGRRGDRDPGAPFADRWLPGQMAVFPVYWAQTEGPVVPAWTDRTPGPRVAPGRYRARVTWLGRIPGARGDRDPGDVWTDWFRVV